MEVRTQRFVTKSDLFDGLETLEEIFNESDHSSITWGGANRTMIGPQYFLTTWFPQERDIISEEGAMGEWEILRGRLNSLPEDVLVGLES